MTLNELSNLENPNNWLFRFCKDQTEEEYLLYLTDLTTADQQKRYNLFHLIEGTDVTFENTGDYHYFIYQMPDGGSTDYSIGLLCEQGITRVEGTEAEIKSFNPTTSAPSYDGQ